MRETVADWSMTAYLFLLPVAQVFVAINVLVVLAALVVRPWRRGGGVTVMASSYLFGLLAWLLACGVTFSNFGWLGLIVGLFVLGIGVMPMAIYAAFVDMSEPRLGWLLIEMLAVTWAARFIGLGLMASYSRPPEHA